MHQPSDVRTGLWHGCCYLRIRSKMMRIYAGTLCAAIRLCRNRLLRESEQPEILVVMTNVLSDHFKSGQRLSLQNRPMEGAGTKLLYSASPRSGKC